MLLAVFCQFHDAQQTPLRDFRVCHNVPHLPCFLTVRATSQPQYVKVPISTVDDVSLHSFEPIILTRPVVLRLVLVL